MLQHAGAVLIKTGGVKLFVIRMKVLEEIVYKDREIWSALLCKLVALMLLLPLLLCLSCILQLFRSDCSLISLLCRS